MAGGMIFDYKVSNQKYNAMKINLKLISLMLVVFMLAVSSCKDDNEPEPLSTVEAEAVLADMGKDMETLMVEMMSTPAASTLFNFMYLSDFDPGIKGQPIPMASDFKEVYTKDATLSQKAIGVITKMISASEYVDPFAEEYGTYSWDFANYTWTYSDLPADKLVYEFPSDMEQTTNNATLTISNFSGVEQGEEFFATSLKITLHIGNSLVLDVNYEADLSDSGLNSVGVSISMLPFEMGANISITSGSEFSTITAGFELKKQGVTITSANVELRVDGSTTINPFETDDDIELILTSAKGFVQMGEVKAQLDLAIADFVAIYDNTTSYQAIVDAANEHLNVTFYTFPEGAKIGTVVWKWDATLYDMVPYFRFNDGTEKPLEEVLGLESDLFDDFDF